MTSRTTKQAEQPPEPAAERPGEELRFRSPTLMALEKRPVTTRAMARRLPQLVRRSLGLA
ncbi:hypothetical protein ACFQ10_17055 [Streptomyces indonesiensis]